MSTSHAPLRRRREANERSSPWAITIQPTRPGATMLPSAAATTESAASGSLHGATTTATNGPVGTAIVANSTAAMTAAFAATIALVLPIKGVRPDILSVAQTISHAS